MTQPDTERWRDGQTPTYQGPWFAARSWIQRGGFVAQVWKDQDLGSAQPVQIWGRPPAASVLMTPEGTRIGVLYATRPSHLPETNAP